MSKNIMVTEEDIEMLKMEANVKDETFEELATRLFKEALPIAVANIARVAEHAANDKTRFEAAKYIVERNLGRLQDAKTIVASPAEKMAKKMMNLE